MAKFRKSIVSAGKYLVSRLGGNRSEESLSEDRLKSWASTANDMISSGINIPAPWSHVDGAGKVPLPVVMDENGSLPRSDINAGWWDNFTVEDGTLFGTLDVPDDSGSKIGTTVKETSVFVQPKYTDGRGNEWPEALMHVALVTHPIQPGQKNFEPIAASILPDRETPLIIAMSDIIMADAQNPTESAASFTIKDVIEHLEQVGIILLPDTTPTNLAERLVAAVKQKLATEQESDDEGTENVTSAPNGSSTQPAPVAMSQETPTEPKVLTDEQSATLENLGKQNAFLMAEITGQKKKTLLDRINELVKTGRIAKAYADEKLVPQLESLQMSLDSSGKISRVPLEEVLDALESSKPLTSPIVDGPLSMASEGLPDGAMIQENDLSWDDEELSDEQVAEFMDY